VFILKSGWIVYKDINENLTIWFDLIRKTDFQVDLNFLLYSLLDRNRKNLYLYAIRKNSIVGSCGVKFFDSNSDSDSGNFIENEQPLTYLGA
jgi:hypothetical protein